MTTRIKSALFFILSTSISLIVAASLLELYVRLMETDGTNFDIEMWRYAKDLKRISDIPDVGHEHIPGKSGVYMGVPVTINSAGWRDREHSVVKENGTVRIMMLGDSLTFGWGAKPEDVTSYRLERLLNTGKSKIEIINTGIGNANTSMEANYFIKKAHVYNPDIVILNYFINDAEQTPRRADNFFMEHFYSAVFISGRFDVIMRRFFRRSDWKHYYRNLYQEHQSGWLATQNALRELVRYCNDRNIRLIVVNYPELHALSPYPFEDITNLVASKVKVLGVPFLDLLPSLEKQAPHSLWVTKTDAHPNGKAAGLYADAIMKFLVKQYPATFEEPTRAESINDIK
ncbi:SGNH/GDSL hydrolase family protein [Mesorhizobium sp. YC-39]|uniref:SGNH/GDSL hydrolase family protein n=1 Tax=unclassified Mesorhizobium TaxID=325217 RepID=UPI0021E7F3F5|nr:MULTISPECIES: SGNH/GDSL hydrolase family protein [unclassified Mesorhizobium]MCV3211527.1 SGNH/GDSL hydrolase family protein [Mesorhizobium sp. YC-2]MCV3233275.1 SGNH/GDSL hydrolase family protein [Mesorhizobium sp. YC-39]